MRDQRSMVEDENLECGRETLTSITSYLVNSVDLRSLSLWKLPSKVHILRESLLWRVEELARNAFETLEADKFVASGLAARAVMETTAAIVFLHNLMQRGIDHGITEALVAKIDRFLFNSKLWDELENPIHINDMLRDVEKVIPGFFEQHYGSLSELAHPNWAGAFGAFGAFDKVNVLANFSKGGRSPETQRKKISSNLAATLGLAKGYYEMIEGKLEPFAKAVEAHYAENPPVNDATN